MKKGEIIYCLDESVYSDHISKRKSYTIKDTKPDQIRIVNNSQKLVWLPNPCFTNAKIPEIIEIKIDDEITDSQNDCIEVTIEFSDGEKRWVTFATVNWLKGKINEHKNYLSGNGLIFVEELSETSINRTIIELDKQNELLHVSNNC